MEEVYNDYSSDVKEIDKELLELLKKQSSKIKVVGVGGGGGNSLTRMKEIGIKGGELIAANTDAQDLLYSDADQKILLGRELTRGLGAGSNPKVGEEAAKESESEIKKKLSGSDMIFITTRKFFLYLRFRFFGCFFPYFRITSCPKSLRKLTPY